MQQSEKYMAANMTKESSENRRNENIINDISGREMTERIERKKRKRQRREKSNLYLHQWRNHEPMRDSGIPRIAAATKVRSGGWR